ncbi:MAG: acyl-CoA dehydrogenase family protein, partial [Bradyrhizobium guangdongense]
MALSTKITFSEEQAMLQDVAVNFCREKVSIGEVRRQIASDSGFDRELWKEISDLGWLAVAVPEEFGGTNLSLAEVVPIVEPMGRHLAGTPFVSTQLFIQGLLAGGSDELKTSILPKICEGAVGTVALFERDGDWDLEHIEAAAVIEGDKARLGGTKTLVCDAGIAEHFLVSVQLAGAPALAVLGAADLPRERRQRETV